MIINGMTFLGAGEPALPAMDTLENMSWDDIATVSAAGEAANYWQVGDAKNVIIGGATYPVEIVGFSHDDLADGSGKAGVTFGLQNCLNTKYAMNSSDHNSGGWGSCALRTTLQNTIFGQLPSDLQGVIRMVTKKASVGYAGTAIYSFSDTLFLFAEIEVAGSANYSVAGEGIQYSRFAVSSSRKKSVNGSTSIWWLRSPGSGDTERFGDMDIWGSPNLGYASVQYGVCFGFCV